VEERGRDKARGDWWKEEVEMRGEVEGRGREKRDEMSREGGRKGGNEARGERWKKGYK
jgi:hypothetical protein